MKYHQLNVDEEKTTGDLVVFSIAIPTDSYKLLSAVAREMGTTTPKLVVQGLSWFLSQIDKAAAAHNNRSQGD